MKSTVKLDSEDFSVLEERDDDNNDRGFKVEAAREEQIISFEEAVKLLKRMRMVKSGLAVRCG